MKIERHKLKSMSIEAFADMYDLTMVVKEHYLNGDLCYMVNFKHVLSLLSSKYAGDYREAYTIGSTEQAAIESYSYGISESMILYQESGQVGSIQVPKLKPEYECNE